VLLLVGLAVLGVALVDAFALAVLLAVLPALAVAQVRVLDDFEIPRLPVYASSGTALVLLGGGAWLVGARGSGEGLGLTGLPPGSLLAWSVGLTLGGLVILGVFRWVAARRDLAEHPLLRALLPRSGRERLAFVGLSLAAGLGEELAYRGYAISALAPVTGPGTAAVATSAVFGVLHAYQGPLGVARAGLLGGLLAWGFLASGSLWPAIVAHAALDMLAGIVLAERLMGPERSEGVPLH
jgi:membrane protease YdiL (CAAX protease family)